AAADYARLIEAVNAHPAPVLALDLPSGLQADTGVAAGAAVRADLTVTFIGVKRGLLTADGPDLCGELAFAALTQLPLAAPAAGERISWHRLQRSGQCLPARRGNVHKGDRKSTRLNSSHVKISYAVFCLKKKTEKRQRMT